MKERRSLKTREEKRVNQNLKVLFKVKSSID